MEAPPAVGTAAQGAEAGDEEAPVWRLASGSSASDDEASRIFFFFLSSAHATLILEASEFPLWFHHIWALAPTSLRQGSSPPCGQKARSMFPGWLVQCGGGEGGRHMGLQTEKQIEHTGHSQAQLTCWPFLTPANAANCAFVIPVSKEIS